MQSPEVRVSDGQKVELKIGDRVPYASGSFQPGIGTVGVSPLVSTQFQFVDTGVNLTITPHVHGTDEVTLDVTADISNVSSTVNLGGLSQPVISQRKTDAHIRVRDGEVSLLGGLMQTQDSATVNGIPGLVNIPIFGKYLFGGTTRDKARGELLVAIIPHIVRKPDIDALDMRGVDVGPEQGLRLRYAAKKEEPAPPPAAVVTPAPAAPTPTAPTATAGVPSLAFNPSSVQSRVSAPVVILLEASNVTDLAAVPVKLHWDPKVLRLDQVTSAALLNKDGNVNPPTLDIRNDAGEATIELTRVQGSPGVSGAGPLIQCTFTAVGKGATNITASDVNLRNTKQEQISVNAPAVVVNVQ